MIFLKKILNQNDKIFMEKNEEKLWLSVNKAPTLFMFLQIDLSFQFGLLKNKRH